MQFVFLLFVFAFTFNGCLSRSMLASTQGLLLVFNDCITLRQAREVFMACCILPDSEPLVRPCAASHYVKTFHICACRI